ncbi:MAG: response regulator [Chitinispirillaceae bacterium]|nr:response regulator [Chitinispirillaceae bacterium]
MDTKKTVLLVDDDVDLLDQTRLVVEKEFAVDVAYSGEEAIKKIADKTFDCIVMDVMMESLSDGLDTAKKIKANEATKSVPVIMLTSVNEHYDYTSQVDSSYFPNDKWLNKPVKPDVLVTEIHKLIG